MSRFAAVALACLAIAIAPASAATESEAGRLPLAYRTTAGAYPWTGRLFAVGWQGSAPVLSPYLWEAGASLDHRSVGSRRIFTSSAPPQRVIALQWDAIDAAFRNTDSADMLSRLDSAQLEWLRGDRTQSGLRQRDTRLGNAAGARVRVVAPPAWAPGKPGHTGFRARYSLRPHVVWLGTNDGLLHGFDAVTGEERAAFLPGVLLPYAAAISATDAPLLPSPCPRPEAQDVTIHGEWRTVLLCGIPGSARTGNPAAAFALDISDPDGPMPFALLWEIAATDTLSLSARGPVRAAGLPGQDGLRWYAVVTLVAATHDKSGAARSGLALLPLDKPAGAAWAGQYAVRTLPLPDRDCLGRPATGNLVAVSVLSDMTGTARAAYATDDAGQLWRFPLADAPQPGGAPAVSCLHRMQTLAQPLMPEAPVLLGSPTAPVVVYGAGNELAAVPDLSSSRGATAVPLVQVAAQAGDGGHILRAQPAGADDAGWHLTLPHAGEQVVEVQPVFPGYLLFVTRTPDGAQRSYLVLAATGESVTQSGTGERLHVATGQLLPPGASVFVTAAELAAAPAQPGRTARQAYELSLWAVDGNTVTRVSQTMASRRTGRLRWREIVGPAREDLP
ncbi:pilus assembly protein PilY [Cupriavidus sp. CP313]